MKITVKGTLLLIAIESLAVVGIIWWFVTGMRLSGL